MKLNTERFSGIFQVPEIYPICVIGAGGIGADTIITAGKMGFREIVVYDDDEVSDENIATQFHKYSDIGKPKVDAISDAAWEYARSRVDAHCERFDRDTKLSFPVEVVISAVDSIQARKDIWAGVLENFLEKDNINWYIDARMAAMEFQMFTVNLNDRNAVRKYDTALLHIDESDIEDLPCTEKATTFTAKAAATHVGTELMHIVKDEAQSRFLVHNLKTQFLYYR